MIEAKNEDCESMPCAPSWYAREPFDPSVVAFLDNRGRPWRYMNSPLDETYIAEPVDEYVAGSLPPEEREVRDTLVATMMFRERVSYFDFWWSRFFKPTESYLVYIEYLLRLEQLIGCSAEHRAAFCRLFNGQQIRRAIRVELKRMVAVHDQVRV